MNSVLSKLMLISLVLLLLLSNVPVTEGKRKKQKKSLFKDRSKAEKDKDSSDYAAPEVEEIKFSSDEEKQEILAKMQAEKNKAQKVGDQPISSDKARELKTEERQLRRELGDVSMQFGEITTQRATVLHKIGRNLYGQQRYNDVWQVSLDILKIHEMLDGPESVKTAMALSNVAQAAFRTQRREECGHMAYRHLYIMLKEKGRESKEVLMARARLMQYHFADGETSNGMSYAEYKRVAGITEVVDIDEDEDEEDRIEL